MKKTGSGRQIEINNSTSKRNDKLLGGKASNLYKQESMEVDRLSVAKSTIDDNSKRSTMLEGIMNNPSKTPSAINSTINSPGFQLRDLPINHDTLKQSVSPCPTNKGTSLAKAKHIAEDIDKKFIEMMSLINDLQKETGMAVKVQDLEKEYNKVFARVKVISKL